MLLITFTSEHNSFHSSPTSREDESQSTKNWHRTEPAPFNTSSTALLPTSFGVEEKYGDRNARRCRRTRFVVSPLSRATVGSRLCTWYNNYYTPRVSLCTSGSRCVRVYLCCNNNDFYYHQLHDIPWYLYWRGSAELRLSSTTQQWQRKRYRVPPAELLVFQVGASDAYSENNSNQCRVKKLGANQHSINTILFGMIFEVCAGRLLSFLFTR